MSADKASKLKKNFLAWLQDLNVDCVSDCDILPSEFLPLLQSQKLKQLWIYLINHVRNGKDAQKITKNLFLQNLRSENKALRQSCNEISDELEKMNVELKRLEEKLNQKRVKCAKSHMTTSKAQKCIDSNNIKSLFYEQCKCLAEEKEKCLHHQNETLKLSFSPHLHSNAIDEQQFYSCRDQLKQLLNSIQDHFHQAHEANSDHTYQHTTDSWKSALAVLRLYPPRMILDALSSITQQCVDQVGTW